LPGCSAYPGESCRTPGWTSRVRDQAPRLSLGREDVNEARAGWKGAQLKIDEVAGRTGDAIATGFFADQPAIRAKLTRKVAEQHGAAGRGSPEELPWRARRQAMRGLWSAMRLTVRDARRAMAPSREPAAKRDRLGPRTRRRSLVREWLRSRSTIYAPTLRGGAAATPCEAGVSARMRKLAAGKGAVPLQPKEQRPSRASASLRPFGNPAA
jgi:hypothetical protein